MRKTTAPSEKDKGFTLIELLVVVVIIGILAAIAVPVFLNQREKAADAAAKSDLKNAATSQESYFVDSTSGYATTDAQLTGAGFKKSQGVTFTIVAANSKGYCLKAKGDNSSTEWFYNSLGGGLLPSGTACTAASLA